MRKGADPGNLDCPNAMIASRNSPQKHVRHVHGAPLAGVPRRSPFGICTRKKSPFRHAWLPLHCRQIRSPAHSLSKVVLHLRHRRDLRSWSSAGWAGLCATY